LINAQIERRLLREETRLLAAYQAEVITLVELRQRRQLLAQRRQALQEQSAEQARLRQRQLQAHTLLADLTQFCARVRGRLSARLSEPSLRGVNSVDDRRRGPRDASQATQRIVQELHAAFNLGRGHRRIAQPQAADGRR